MTRLTAREALRLFRYPACALVAAALLVSACSRQSPSSAAKDGVTSASATDPAPSNPAAPAPSATQGDFSTAIMRVAQEVLPAVVHIEVTERQTVTNPFAGNPFFQQFFGNMPHKFERVLRGLGSGIIMDAEGHIVTNNHVAGGATKIQVVLATGESYPGKLVGADPMTDLAVVKIDAGKPLPHVTFADSDQVKVGQWVVAIGDPRGFAQTVTQGIISAKHRAGVTNPTSYQDFLQTDAAINPGNSGGPLLDLQGKVIGVNAVIATTSGGFQGIGFSIPSNMTVHVAKQLIETGKVQRGWLGLTVQDITPELSQALGLNTTNGALVADVTKGGPADSAGVRRGDVVTGFDGQPVDSANDLRNDAATATIGSEATLTVLRKGKQLSLKAKIGNLQRAIKLLSASLQERIGASVGPVPPQVAENYGLKPGEGVVITQVDPNGPFATVGLEVGDIVLEANGVAISGVQEFMDMVTTLPHSATLALLALDHRTGNTGYLQVKLK